MKCLNNLMRAVFVAAIVCTNVLFVSATKGDFGAWNTTADGHDGLYCGKVEFTEKDLTLEFWLYIDEQEGKNATGTNVLSTRHDGSTGFSVNLNTNTTNDNSVDVRFFVKTDMGTIYTFYLPRAEFSDKWGHAALVVDSTNEFVAVYLNGELYGDPIENMDGKWLGNNADNSGLWIAHWWSDAKFYGKLSEIRIWNKARTAEEIAENYNQRLDSNTEEGLYIYYSFDEFEEVVQNLASPGRNDGTLKPADTWNTVHSFEVLSAMPTALTVTGNNVTWQGTADSFDVEVIEKESGEVAQSEEVTTNSYTLTGLDETKKYYVKVRAKTDVFYSAWASSNATESGLNTPNVGKLGIVSAEGSLIITSDAIRSLNIFAIDGRVVRTVELTHGRNVVSDLAKGVYLIENQKVMVK